MNTKGNRFSLKSAASNIFAYPLVLAAILFLVLPVASGGSDFGQLLSGKPFPLAVKLKDLNGDWRRLTIRGGGSISGNVSVNVNGNSGGPASQNNLVGSLGGGQTYVTKGVTVSAKGQIYLVAYHLPSAGLDLSMLLQALATKTPPTAAVLTPESTLSLSLLDVHMVGSLEDVRPFDATWEIGESAKAAKVLSTLLKGEEGTEKPAKPSQGGSSQ
ncbi:MAG: hypothetical protein ACLQU3_19065 [Limisphaerales bacterium]